MRPGRFLLVVCACVAIITPVGAQETKSSVVAPLKDPNAVQILGKTLDAAGGQGAFSAVSDISASGTIIRPMGDKSVETPITLTGRALGDLRLDENLPSGVRTWAAFRGTAQEKTEDGTISETSPSSMMSPAALVNPYLLLAQALKSKFYSITYKGQMEVDGIAVEDVQIRRTVQQPDGSLQPIEIGALEFFIDVNSSRVLMTRDQARPSRNSAEGPPHELRYADYRLVNNLLVPFLILETIDGTQTWRIQIDSLVVNSGISDTIFKLR